MSHQDTLSLFTAALLGTDLRRHHVDFPFEHGQVRSCMEFLQWCTISHTFNGMQNHPTLQRVVSFSSIITIHVVFIGWMTFSHRFKLINRSAIMTRKHIMSWIFATIDNTLLSYGSGLWTAVCLNRGSPGPGLGGVCMLNSSDKTQGFAPHWSR